MGAETDSWEESEKILDITMALQKTTVHKQIHSIAMVLTLYVGGYYG
jgi:hypothetical protein